MNAADLIKKVAAPGTDALNAVDRFKKVAAASACCVVEVKTLQEAMDYALILCEKKPLRELLPVGAPAPEKTPRASGLSEKDAPAKVLAAPKLDAEAFARLAAAGAEKGVSVIQKGLRGYLSGIDVGFAVARHGIAETGTCVLDSVDEDLRLSTMLCEISVLALKKSAILDNPQDIDRELSLLLAEDPMYVAFISSPSKTSDIERVLTLGVHGPLELHVVLVEG